jgi:hypothetical protein
MDKELRRDRSRVGTIPVAILLMAAVVTALVIAAKRNDILTAGNDQPVAGSSGIARPHPPLDRAPGEPLKTPL